MTANPLFSMVAGARYGRSESSVRPLPVRGDPERRTSQAVLATARPSSKKHGFESQTGFGSGTCSRPCHLTGWQRVAGQVAGPSRTSDQGWHPSHDVPAGRSLPSEALIELGVVRLEYRVHIHALQVPAPLEQCEADRVGAGGRNLNANEDRRAGLPSPARRTGESCSPLMSRSPSQHRAPFCSRHWDRPCAW